MSNYKFFQVSNLDHGIRIDKYVISIIPNAPYSSIQRAIRNGDIRASGKKIQPNYIISMNEEIRIFTNWIEHVKNLKKDPVRLQSWKDKIKDWILYQDNDFIIINKPAGMASQGGSGIKISIDKMPWEPPAKILHRLDKETSGVMLLSTTAAATRHVSILFKQQKVFKRYLCIVHGNVKRKNDIIDVPLIKQSDNNFALMVPSDDIDAYDAITEYNLIYKGRDFSILEILPKTGRMHQIRAHMQYIGHPIIGDRLYGNYNDKKQLLLNCNQIEFQYNNKNISQKAPLPIWLEEYEPFVI